MRMPHSAFTLCALLLFFCLTIQPTWAAEATTPTKKEVTTPKKTAPAKRSTASAKKKAGTAATVVNEEKLQNDLDMFAKSCITKMNNHLTPGITTKQVTQTPEGYRVHYLAVDPDSLSTSFSRSAHKSVPYIGRMIYHEVEYVCMGETEKEAMAGPFYEANRRPMTELIKYMKGKWTY